jgi:RNA polymerase sigma factor (sigma-70 family)
MILTEPRDFKIPEPSQVPDQSPSVELLSLARAGDTAAFGELCRQYEARLFRHARTLCSDHATAEDLAQETFIAAWKSIARFNHTCQFSTWLCAILLNLHRHRQRKNWFWKIIASGESATPQQDLASPPENELEYLADHAPTASDSLEAEDQLIRVRALLTRLPRKQRDVLFLRFFAAESLAGIAAALNCSVGTVKSRLFNGLEKLRKIAPKEFQP